MTDPLFVTAIATGGVDLVEYLKKPNSTDRPIQKSRLGQNLENASIAQQRGVVVVPLRG